MAKTMDTASPNAEKLEFAVVERFEGGVRLRMLEDTEINKLMAPKKESPEKSPDAKEGEEGAGPISHDFGIL